jgi:hypothetical protein
MEKINVSKKKFVDIWIIVVWGWGTMRMEKLILASLGKSCCDYFY